MTETTTVTQTTLRLELVSLEMQSLNDRSLKDKLLNEIIAFCVPQRCLGAITIYGFDGDEAHMRLEIEIDYDEHDQQVKLSGEGLPEGIAGRCTGEDGPSGGNGNGTMQPPHCPYMGQALALYMRVIKEKGLRLHWTVRFRERRQEMCEKFGLSPTIICDCTAGCMENTVPNSLLSELSMNCRASSKAVPA